MKSWKIWVAFSIGVAAGATVALVCAPQTGKKTRKQIRNRLDDAGDYLKDQLDDAGEYAKEQASVLSEHASKAYQRSKDALTDYAGDAGDRLQSAFRSAKNKVA